ncbi:MAG: hypothetical protein RIC15_10425 [Vicingaceae bacterium]
MPNLNFNRFILSISILSTAVLNQNCSKTEGCIDPNASNYLYEAKKNDGSCLYDLSFWMNTIDHGIMDIYVDNQLKGRLNCAFVSSRPTCGVDTLVGTGYLCVVNVPLMTGSHFVRVEAEDGTIWENTYNLGQNCKSILIAD